MRVPSRVCGCAILLLLAGCGSSNLVSVTGEVTVDGKPLTSGVVTFHPKAAGPVGVANIQSDGSFTAKTGNATGIPPGDYVVTVVATEVEEPTPENPEPQPKYLAPEKYGDKSTSGLNYTIEGGEHLKLDL